MLVGISVSILAELHWLEEASLLQKEFFLIPLKSQLDIY